MSINSKIFTFLVIICIFNFSDVRATQRTSKKKCEEYRNLIKSKTCIESSGTEGTAKFGDYPHMAIIGYYNDESDKTEWSCAGVLISEQYVITEAHCLSKKNATVVRLGELNINTDSDNTHVQDIKVSKTIIHPKYTGSLYNDIALIQLEKPVLINQYVRPACLPATDETIDFSNVLLIKSGWGLLPQKHKEPKPYLIYNKKIRTVPYETCKKSYLNLSGLQNGLDESSHLCLATHEESCQMISGSAVQTKIDNLECMYKIIGLVSFARRKCEGDSPEVSTKILPYLDWIENIVWA